MKQTPSMDWIIPDSDPRLRNVSAELVLPMSESELMLMDRMISYIDASYNGEYQKYNIRPGIAIASNQVGLFKRLIYLHFDDEYGKEWKLCLMNPKINKKSDEVIYLENGEGCLSVPVDHKGIVPRNYEVTVSGYDLLNHQDITFTVSGLRAIAIQHEIDHLDGILYYDHINVLDPNYVNKNWRKL